MLAMLYIKDIVYIVCLNDLYMYFLNVVLIIVINTQTDFQVGVLDTSLHSPDAIAAIFFLSK